MQTVFLLLTLGMALVAGSPVGLVVQAADAASGSWELNVAKSTYSPGPAPKSETRTYDISGQSVKYTAKGVDAQGKATLVQYTANYDGKDYPMTGNSNSDAISLKRIDTNTIEFTQKKAGKTVITGTRVVSKDGKAMTVTAKGTNAAGQPYSVILLLERR